MEMKKAPAIDRLNEIISYNPDNGLFAWVKRRPGIQIDRTPGNKSNFGYLRISIDGVSYQAHRLAWYITNHDWPDCDIDHINGDRADNRICNLRLATRSQNLANRMTLRNGLKGVYFHKKKQKWHARIQSRGKLFSLGYHATEAAAHEEYVRAAQKYHGEFARSA